MSDAVENQAPEPVQLSLGDVQMFVQIIDLCSKRGAFEGAELEAIGALRGKTVKFLEASQPAPEGEVPTGTEPVQAEMDMDSSTEES